MTWTSWRLQRSVHVFFVALSLVLIVYIVADGLHIETLHHQWLDRPCHGGNGFAAKFQTFCQSRFYEYSNALGSGVYVHWIALISTTVLGLLLGANAVAGEIDHGTARTAWTQSVTRARWYGTKNVVGIGLLVVLAVPLCISASWWLQSTQWTPRVSTMGFDYAGWMPLATGIFAFAVTTTIGVVLRRPGWTIAAGLVVMVLVAWTMQWEVRAHLVPLKSTTIVLSPVTKGSVTVGAPTGQAPANSWVIFRGYEPRTYGLTVPSQVEENRWDNVINDCTLGSTDPNVYVSCLQKLDIRDVELYVADNQYWTLQLREGGLYLAGSALLLGLGLILVRHTEA